MLPPQAAAMVGQLDSWARGHRDFIALIWERFSRDAVWPNAQLLSRELFSDGARLNVTNVGRQLPPQLGRLDTVQGTIVLTVRGLSYADDAKSIAYAYVQLLRVAIDRFAAPDQEPIVRASEFAGLLDLTPLEARLLEEVAQVETWALRPHGGEPGDRAVLLDDQAVYHVADVGTVEAYLDAQAAAWWPGGEPSVPRADLAPQQPPVEVFEPARDPLVVAVAYGRDDAARQAMFGFLRELGLRPLEWEHLVQETGSATPYSGEAVAQAFAVAQAVVVLFTPDDEVRLHKSLAAEPQAVAMQPRPNVLFEAGMALATHPTRTVIVEIGSLRPVTNLAGRNVIRLGSDAAALVALAGRIEAAGCPIDRRARDWLKIARFACLDAVTRVAEHQAGDGSAAGHDHDDFTLELAAAAATGSVDLTEPQLAALSTFLRTTDDPFDSAQVANALPSPTVTVGGLKRVLAQLHRNGVISRAPTGRGYLRPGHPDVG